MTDESGRPTVVYSRVKGGASKHSALFSDPLQPAKPYKVTGNREGWENRAFGNYLRKENTEKMGRIWDEKKQNTCF